MREISDLRDETDKNGLKITLDLKRGTDPDKLMTRLFKMTTLQDTFSCNFNILIDSRRSCSAYAAYSASGCGSVWGA